MTFSVEYSHHITSHKTFTFMFIDIGMFSTIIRTKFKLTYGILIMLDMLVLYSKKYI